MSTEGITKKHVVTEAELRAANVPEDVIPLVLKAQEAARTKVLQYRVKMTPEQAEAVRATFPELSFERPAWKSGADYASGKVQHTRKPRKAAEPEG